jgi:hypothetical protein
MIFPNKSGIKPLLCLTSVLKICGDGFACARTASNQNPVSFALYTDY